MTEDLLPTILDENTNLILDENTPIEVLDFSDPHKLVKMLDFLFGPGFISPDTFIEDVAIEGEFEVKDSE